MAIYVNYDLLNLFINSYYDTQIYDLDSIPEPRQEITLEEWQNALAINANKFDNDTDFNLIREEVPVIIEDTPENLRNECIQYLARSQYYIDRNLQTGDPIPAGVQEKRTKCYNVIGEIELPDTPLLDGLP